MHPNRILLIRRAQWNGRNHGPRLWVRLWADVDRASTEPKGRLSMYGFVDAVGGSDAVVVCTVAACAVAGRIVDTWSHFLSAFSFWKWWGLCIDWIRIDGWGSLRRKRSDSLKRKNVDHRIRMMTQGKRGGRKQDFSRNRSRESLIKYVAGTVQSSSSGWLTEANPRTQPWPTLYAIWTTEGSMRWRMTNFHFSIQQRV